MSFETKCQMTTRRDLEDCGEARILRKKVSPVNKIAEFAYGRTEVSDILAAIDLHRLHWFSFWDALIVRSAKQAGCSILFLERTGKVGANMGYAWRIPSPEHRPADAKGRISLEISVVKADQLGDELQPASS